VARAAAVSVASRRRGPLRYRLGVVTAQPPAATAASSSSAAASPPLGVLDGFGALHAQAACAIGGNVCFYPRAPPAAPDGLRRWPKKRRPEYSAMPQRARATLGAWVGALARAPLARAPAGAAAAAAAPQAPSLLPPPLARALSSLRGDHYAFASLSAAVQLGGFSRPLLDYTALSLRCDVSHASGALAAEAASAARGAVAATPPLAGSGASASGAGAVPPLGVHVTLGAAQQLVGPVRLRADVRLSGEAAAAAARAAWSGKSAADVCAADAAFEAVYGVDVALPQVLGAARVVAWYSPQRGEGLVELRFLET
jgi:hypothetical protein